MINNNPYNLPDRPMQKHTRIYTQSNTNNNISHYRNQSIENIPVSVISHPNHNHNRNIGNQQNIIMKRSTISTDDVPNNFRPPFYPPVRNQIKHFMHSPKNNTSMSTLTNPNLSSINNPQLAHSNAYPIQAHSNPLSNMQTIANKEIRDSLNSVDSKQISKQLQLQLNTNNNKQIVDKIQALGLAIKNNQKRIQQLQKTTNNSSILPNNSKLQQEQLLQYQKTQIYKSLTNKYQSEWLQNIQKIRDDVFNIREQVKTCMKITQADKIIKQKVRQIKDKYKSMENKIVLDYQHKNQLEKEETILIKRQIQFIKNQLDQKIKKNHDFLTTVVSRIQKQVHNQLTLSPQYKSTGIKCTGTAILLRFIQNFKVRKNNTPASKNNEIKITITDNTYYIDNQGYLLDKDQFYLVDNRGVQIRLEQRHIKVLRQENVLG